MMPIISQFYGIIIRMYYDDKQGHHSPHFHAKYSEYEAVFNLEGEMIAGKFPKKQQSYIIAWADIHRKEL